MLTIFLLRGESIMTVIEKINEINDVVITEGLVGVLYRDSIQIINL